MVVPGLELWGGSSVQTGMAAGVLAVSYLKHHVFRFRASARWAWMPLDKDVGMQ